MSAALSAGLGHNHPPPLGPNEVRAFLAEEHADLMSRRDALLGGVARFTEAFPTINNDEDQAKAGDFVKQIAAAIKRTEEKRVPAKEPFLAGGRAVDAFFKDISGPLTAGMKAVQAPMTAYATEQERIRRAEAARVAAAAAEEARRVAKQVAEAAEAERVRLAEAEAAAMRNEAPEPPLPLPPAPTIDDAIAAANVAQAAARTAAARPADFSRSRGELGSVSSLRERVAVEMININLVPREFLMFDEAAARKAAQADEFLEIPGVRITRSTHIQTR